MAKRILVTGAGSYIGKSFQKYMSKFADYEIKMIRVSDGSWEKEDFCGYDVCLHLAGIAHVSRSSKMKNLYYEVNRDLTLKIATKAKTEKIKQFIFMSSIIVYGDADIIDKNTVPEPIDFYGKSKLEAELELNEIVDEKFSVVNVRSPMVYGYGCKGNFRKLTSFSKLTPIFPKYDNKRSMIYIENLCEFLKIIIDNNKSGVFLPQNKEYVCTRRLMESSGRIFNNNIYFFSCFNSIIKKLLKKSDVLNKVFGDKVYAFNNDESSYNIVNFQESIRNSLVEDSKL